MKKTVRTKKAAPAVGAYSQACTASGEFTFTSGQVALTPEGELKNTGTIEEETRQVLANLEAILGAAALKLSDVVKATIYLTDISNFKEVNELYTELMPQEYPARTTIGVNELPLGAHIEIDMIAVKTTDFTHTLRLQ